MSESVEALAKGYAYKLMSTREEDRDELQQALVTELFLLIDDEGDRGLVILRIIRYILPMLDRLMENLPEDDRDEILDGMRRVARGQSADPNEEE